MIRVVILIFILSVSCTHQPKNAWDGSRSPASNVEHYTPLSNLMQLKGETRSSKDCNIKFGKRQKSRKLIITVNGYPYRVFYKETDDWAVESATFKEYLIIQNIKKPYEESPLDFANCPDCYEDNELVSILSFPPPHSAKPLERFIISRTESDGEIKSKHVCTF